MLNHTLNSISDGGPHQSDSLVREKQRESEVAHVWREERKRKERGGGGGGQQGVTLYQTDGCMP